MKTIHCVCHNKTTDTTQYEFERLISFPTLIDVLPSVAQVVVEHDVGSLVDGDGDSGGLPKHGLVHRLAALQGRVGRVLQPVRRLLHVERPRRTHTVRAQRVTRRHRDRVRTS